MSNTDNEIERRELLKAAGFAAGVVASSQLIALPAIAQSSTPAGGKSMAYKIKPLSIDPKSIKGISEKVLVSHYENNYVGAVRRLNAIQEQLGNLDFAKAPVFQINGLKREELIAMNYDPARALF